MRRLRSILPALAAVLIAGAWGPGAAAAGLQRTASGRQLWVDCRGEKTAAPTVILESGAFGISADWDHLLPDLARDGRVCAYDRGGLGRSPRRPGGEDVVSIAHELADLLDGMGETAPVILVGHSNGALYAETFAAMWPDRLAGLVYVNGVGSDDLDHKVLMNALDDERRIAGLAFVAGRMHLAPLIAGFVIRHEGLTGEAAERKRESLTSLCSLQIGRNEDRMVTPGLSAARALGGSPRQVPTVVVIAASKADLLSRFGWRDAEMAPADRSARGWTLSVLGASHVSPLGRDRRYVVAAVTWLRSISQPPAATTPPATAP
ncbi:alpha/beta fold hydrolase [Caulobacter sp. KR2-114]|uniref:alpha/beta fold hydrolase n=1 Tax=Caulobacter sp. KR2-114 TaxID=3400912 RepID=UPI003C089DA7